MKDTSKFYSFLDLFTTCPKAMISYIGTFNMTNLTVILKFDYNYLCYFLLIAFCVYVTNDTRTLEKVSLELNLRIIIT